MVEVTVVFDCHIVEFGLVQAGFAIGRIIKLGLTGEDPVLAVTARSSHQVTRNPQWATDQTTTTTKDMPEGRLDMVNRTGDCNCLRFSCDHIGNTHSHGFHGAPGPREEGETRSLGTRENRFNFARCRSSYRYIKVVAPTKVLCPRSQILTQLNPLAIN